MIRRLLARMETLQRYMDDARDVCARIGARDDDPSPLLIALPIMYQRFTAHNEMTRDVDPKLCDLAGMYLAKRLPELERYFLPRGALERIDVLRAEVEERMREREAAESAAGGAP